MTQSVPVVPDYLGAIFSRLNAYQPLLDLMLTKSTRVQISGGLGTNWADHTFAILVRDPGAMPEDVESGRFQSMIDTFWYGPTQYESKHLWRIAHYWLCPDGRTMANCYTAGDTVFDGVQHLGGPTYQVEEQTSWPYHVVRYLFRFRAS